MSTGRNLAQELLSPQLSDGGTRPAILCKGARLSYAELSARAQACAARLAARGIGPGQRVAHCIPNCPEFFAAWLAIQWIGGVAVSIPPVYRRREIVHIVNDSETAAIICTPETREHLIAAQPGFGLEVPLLDASTCCAPERAGRVPVPHPTGADDPAIITYITSADGPPRGVVQSASQILAGADAYAGDVLRLTRADVCGGHSALSWAYGLGMLLVCPLRVGAATALLDTFAPALLESAASARTTVLFGVATMYRLLLRQPDVTTFDLSALRCCVSSAEPLPSAVAEEWQARTGREILNGLGTTELGYIVISSRPGAVRPESLGRPIAGYEARILASVDDMQDAPDGTAGHLAVRGPTGGRYWRDPDAEHRAVRNGWTLTGDICVRREDGSFDYCRRADGLIVSGGYKISPAEVRRVLLEHPAVPDAIVLETPDPTRGAVATAVVEPACGVEPDGLPELLQLYLKRELAPYKCPREIRIR